MSLSTHVLDATAGVPAVGVSVTLERRTGTAWAAAAQGHTDRDGRIADLGVPDAGVYRLSFATGAFFAARDVATFYPEVTVTFEIVDPAAHHHVPLLLSPFAFSTYRGS
ncbi:MAG: hydroxyisourate hydrolase [Jatrophihabitantaceae bacterium]